jgi:glutamate 5-kinase
VRALIAARIATGAGCAMAIALGNIDHPLAALEQGARCTWFLPAGSDHSARKRFIHGTLHPTTYMFKELPADA